MLKIIKIAKNIFTLLLPERLGVRLSLGTKKLAAFVRPSEWKEPTVDMDSRFPLEQLESFLPDFVRYHVSDAAFNLLSNTFKNLIEYPTYTTVFPISKLHGFASSKSNLDSNPMRASQKNMASMGALVDDLRGLKGLDGEVLIEKCLDWPELRLEQGIKLITDNWHRRFYWQNAGGSHHMAVLCHQLKKQNKEKYMDVLVTAKNLNPEALRNLEGRVSVFLVMNEPDMHGTLFHWDPSLMGTSSVRSKMGAVLLPMDSLGSLSIYKMIIIDHSREYADLSLQAMHRLVHAGKAMPLVDFLYQAESLSQSKDSREHSLAQGAVAFEGKITNSLVCPPVTGDE